MTDTEKAINTVKDKLLGYEHGYGSKRDKEGWENVLNKLEQLDHLEKGLKGLLVK